MCYTNHNLNRLTTADQGHWNGSAITSATGKENWSLTQTGNWASFLRDVDGTSTVNTAVATDAVTLDEMDDTRTPASNFNGANEFTGSITKTVGLVGGGTTTQTVNYTSAYDAVGNFVDDKLNYKYRPGQKLNLTKTVLVKYSVAHENRRILGVSPHAAILV